ncbi:DUF2264 domain-containing protein [Carnobacterium gallinarum]|uniref:DUF2264 domain-containing protein n=1 Tax=Carnobacterium gallinarum TaxID=2749 RepID=UPI00054FA60D|nr:DUF2264 domain-containing protein [Carnobacterium gallinarum]
MSEITNREELVAYYQKLVGATKAYREEGNGRLKLGYSSAHYDDDQAEIEGFLRLLWGAGPLEGAESSEDFAYFKGGILAGVDPKSEHYWGAVQDFDQLIVEMAALAVTIMTTKEQFWDSLNEENQLNLYNWLDQINHVGVHRNNWRFFRILVNVVFIKLEKPYSEAWLKEDLDAINSMYLEKGWYFDGNPQQMDYYIPWAFHYYGLIYASEMMERDPEQSRLFIERATEFAQDFRYWFDENGAAVPYGRSLTYRFAQGAFWSALVYADVEALPWGEIKGILLKHFTYWSGQSACRLDGILSLGYGYENMYMTESYNSPGSPYWAFKTFLLLGVTKDHPFWKAEAIYPQKNAEHLISTAKMMLTNESNQNVLLYPADQFTTQAHAAEKYSKFVYSSRFGFSVSKDMLTLKQGAFDNTLAISEKGLDHYIIKERTNHSQVTQEYLKHQWIPMPDVEVTTWIVPLGAWHVRIHEIKTQRELDIADGGFSNCTTNGHAKDQKIFEFKNGLLHRSEVGTIASLNIQGYHEYEGLFADPNTNLLFQHTVIPTLKITLAVGEHVLISGHYGSVEVDSPEDSPEVQALVNGYQVEYKNKKIMITK